MLINDEIVRDFTFIAEHLVVKLESCSVHAGAATGLLTFGLRASLKDWSMWLANYDGKSSSERIALSLEAALRAL